MNEKNELKLDVTFWDTCWKNNITMWDLKVVSPPIKSYVDTLQDKAVAILIPGCGNAYEAQYLLENGFKNVTIIDISPTLAVQLLQKLENYIGKELTVICGNFFTHTGQYDVIIEQTFFCALDPKIRKDYTEKMHQLLKPTGKLVGLMFNKIFSGGPPFGGSQEEYFELFSTKFDILKMENCENSIKPRAGTELFIELTPKI
jgi:SAM-dependent methyltransferase